LAMGVGLPGARGAAVSARSLPRQYGVVLRCNWPDCTARYTTAMVGKTNNRKAAALAGWIRGLSPASGSAAKGTGEPANKRWDICPEHAVLELAKVAERRARAEARRKKRDENRAKRDAQLRAAALALDACTAEGP